MTSATKAPHLTPRSLVGRRFAPDIFGPINIAIVGYCPPPAALNDYRPEHVNGQHFIHVTPDSVRILTHGASRFLSLAHVYGGPVSATTIEELAYYGVDYVLAYGLAGGLGTKGVKMGDFYVVESALSTDGTTPHYTDERLLRPDADLLAAVTKHWSSSAMVPARAATGDALYREDDDMLDAFRAQGCDIVNLDTSHLYAVSRTNAENRVLRAVQCGVISDVVPMGGKESKSALAEMLAGGSGEYNPLEQTGDIVRFYIEKLAPQLERRP
jgi:hypothetical protein